MNKSMPFESIFRDPFTMPPLPRPTPIETFYEAEARLTAMYSALPHEAQYDLFTRAIALLPYAAIKALLRDNPL